MYLPFRGVVLVEEFVVVVARVEGGNRRRKLRGVEGGWMCVNLEGCFTKNKMGQGEGKMSRVE